MTIWDRNRSGSLYTLSAWREYTPENYYSGLNILSKINKIINNVLLNSIVKSMAL